jgi:hypothetical protein
MTPREWALEYVGRGWYVLPLYPIVGGRCSCPDRIYKIGPDPMKWKCTPGKHPFGHLQRGVKDATNDPKRVDLWWGQTMWPNAGVGIALAPSGLLDVAPDGVDDLADFIARGLPETLTFRSGGGEGHQHFLFGLPQGAPHARLCLPKHYDLLSDGYCVAPPTLHESGGTYQWLAYDSQSAPKDPPLWACELLVDHVNGRTPAAEASVPGEAILGENGEPPLDIDRDVWEGVHAADRSSGLWAIAGDLAQEGANEETIVVALRERDQTLGWRKFTDRKDAEQRYRDTARRQLANALPRVRLSGGVSVGSSTPPPTAAVPDTTPWPDPLEDVAFYGPLGEFVLAASRQSEADPAAILAMTMSAVSATLDPRTGGYAANAWHPIRLSSVIVGPTAKGRKGSASKIAEAVVRGADPDFVEHIVEGLSSGEGVIWAIRDAIQKWDLKKQDWITEDPGIRDKRLLIIESEFANVLRVLEREGNTLSAVLRRVWDLPSNGVLQMVTKTSPARATGAHVVIAGHVTRDELLSYVSRTELINGFANRFLWFAARRQRELPFGEQVDPILVGNFASVVARAIDWSQAGHHMEWSKPAQVTWTDAYHQLGYAGAGMHGAVTARGEPQVLRMTEFFAALDRTRQMSVQHLEAAVAVWAYVDRTCRWIFGDIVGNQHADDILFGLRQGPMTRTEISQWLGKHVNAAAISRALQLLETAHLARMAMQTAPSGHGRPAEVWSAR